jgi:hypothetical protein
MVGLLALASLARIERHQPGIAAGRGGIDGDRAFAGKAVEIVRATRLRTGARKSLATKWLHADDRADDVAVDVGVADVQAVGDALDRFIDAAVDAQRQPVAGIGDGFADLVEILGTPADDVQDRPEDFAPEPRDKLSIS